jgi:tRNA-2-methylthio-N6-dimethylallyladenosine synthase
MNEEIPGLSLSTDIIVGFVKETEEEFQDTLKAEEECKFDMIYISEYSARPGTASARLQDDVAKEVKAERKEVLNEVLKQVALEKNNKMIGTTQKVLIDRLEKKTGYLKGRTANNKLIRIANSSDPDLVGKFEKVKVTDCTPWSLEGKVIASS